MRDVFAKRRFAWDPGDGSVVSGCGLCEEGEEWEEGGEIGGYEGEGGFEVGPGESCVCDGEA